MSALGHYPTSRDVRVISVISLKVDIHQRRLHVGLAQQRKSLGSCQGHFRG